MRFSLLTLVGLVTLIAVELFALKNTSATKYILVSYAVYALVLFFAWGAFCLSGRPRQFCRGAAVLAWISILYNSPILRVESFFDFPISPLAKQTAEFLEQPLPADIEFSRAGDRQLDELNFIMLWNQWSVLNIGLLGGFFALQIRPPLNATPLVAKSPATVEPTDSPTSPSSL